MGEIPGINPDAKKPKELRPAQAEMLTPFGDEFFIKNVEDGQDVKIGTGGSSGIRDMFVRCDFSSFKKTLDLVSTKKFDELFNAVGELKKDAPELDDATRKLLHACWRVARMTRNLLGEVAEGKNMARQKSFVEHATTTTDGKNVSIRPLSESKGTSMCAEYALMSQQVLKRAGIESAVVVGTFSEDPEDPVTEAHTYLVVDNGKYVFDPTHSALQTNSWPPKVFLAETPLTLETLRNMEPDPEKSFGKKINCTDLLSNEIRMYGTGAT